MLTQVEELNRPTEIGGSNANVGVQKNFYSIQSSLSYERNKDADIFLCLDHFVSDFVSRDADDELERAMSAAVSMHEATEARVRLERPHLPQRLPHAALRVSEGRDHRQNVGRSLP